MNISVNIPTYKRADGCLTYNYLPNATFWVHEFEVKEYREKNPEMQIRILPDTTRGNIAKVRNYILDKTKDADVSVQFDDDMTGVGYFEDGKDIKVGETDLLDMIERYSSIAKQWGAYLWGVNVNSDNQSYREYTPFSTTSYVSASFSCFLKGNTLRYDERFSLKEDYDMTIQQCNKYRVVLRVNKMHYFKKTATNKGGCASYRNIDIETAQLRLLQKKWGTDIVKQDRSDRSHGSKKVKKVVDYNPIIKIPIKGV